MDDECSYTEEELLAIHAEAERVERQRCIGVAVMYIPAALCLALIFLGILLGILLLPVYRLAYDLSPAQIDLWMGWTLGPGAILIPVVFVLLPIGAVLRADAARRLNLWYREHRISDCSPCPRLRVGERFGPSVVRESSTSRLLLTRPRFILVRATARLTIAFCGPAALGLAGWGFFFSGNLGWHTVWQSAVLLGGLPFCIGGGIWAARATPLRLDVTAEPTAQFAIEILHKFVFRSVCVFTPKQLKLFCIADRNLFIAERMLDPYAEEEGAQEDESTWIVVPDGPAIARVGDGDVGVWCARRIIKEILRLIDVPGTVTLDTFVREVIIQEVTEVEDVDRESDNLG
ncbi:MAG: hypothetical protein O7D97_09920 [Planctomycetota bacterium]|nr:hypothetical protein [Planctomycetota bacterium]MCZ6812307.1 hypothetical protein [Planctomycetota bacterium]